MLFGLCWTAECVIFVGAPLGEGHERVSHAHFQVVILFLKTHAN